MGGLLSYWGVSFCWWRVLGSRLRDEDLSLGFQVEGCGMRNFWGLGFPYVDSRLCLGALMSSPFYSETTLNIGYCPSWMMNIIQIYIALNRISNMLLGGGGGSTQAEHL